MKPLFAGFPDKIEVTRRTKGSANYYFILNHSGEAVSLKIGAGFYDLSDGKNAAALSLPAYGYEFLRKTN